MKICPTCRTTYDDVQNYCLNDGTLLVSYAASEPQQVEPLEPETIVHPRESSDVVVQIPQPAASVAVNRQTGANNPISPPPVVVPAAVVVKKSNTAKIIALTALGTIFLVGLVGAAAWMLTQKRETQIAAVNDNKNVAKPKNSNVNTNTNPVNIAVNSNVNTNLSSSSINSNANSLGNLAKPSPTADPIQNMTVRKAVDETLSEWKESTENRDIDTHLGYYAQNVNYYNGGIVSADKVRTDREKAFNEYNNIEISLGNVKITPDPTGNKATVVLDKTWRFANDEKTSEGSVQQQLTLEKQNDRWYITGEKDLKVYYKTKY